MKRVPSIALAKDHSNPSVLYADDDPISRQLIATLLKQAGCEVCLAENGRAAWAKICQRKGTFDRIITDHAMPEMSGLDLTRRLHDRHLTDRVIVCSASTNATDVAEYQALGVSRFLPKPIRKAALLALL